MDVILGIDIGGSTTKIVGLDTRGNVLSMLRVRAEDQVTSLYGALGNYLTSNRLALSDVKRVVLTGVGASYVEGDIYGLPTYKVDEFSASGTGALALSGQSSAVVVTMGPKSSRESLPDSRRRKRSQGGTGRRARHTRASFYSLRWI